MMIKRKCLDDDCYLSEQSTPCLREQMFWHIEKIPMQKMIEIVRKYKLVRFPDVLNRRTLANLICDCTVESVADEILTGDK